MPLSAELSTELNEAVSVLRRVDPTNTVVQWWDTEGQAGNYTVTFPSSDQDVWRQNLDFYRDALRTTITLPDPSPDEVATLITLLIAVVEEWPAK